MLRKSTEAVQHILVMRAGALGDCLLMLPALSALRAHFPRARIDVMGYPTRWQWVLGRGLVDAVHTIERPGMHLLFCPGSEVPGPLKSFLGAYDVILSYRPDPDGLFESGLRALGPRRVLSQSPFPPPPPPKVHVADFALHLVTRLGAPAPDAAPRLWLSDDELALAQPFFDTHQVDPFRHPIVAVHPGSGSEAKRWPLENFATLIETLESQPRVRTIIIAGYAEKGVVAELLSLLHKAKPLLAENWPLLPTAALIGQATVFVGHDSGLTHLAAALGRPTVAIFGPTDPEVWGPRGQHVTVVQMLSEHAVGDGRNPGWRAFPTTRSDVCQVLDTVQRWLALGTPTRSRGDRSA
ncbi:MAG TPA: glycosyltransferase family 9 protein [Candidatus Tectomicrobia bacterium]|nr:glycosyltransferase family 9 protein [Candidatus Tectomicrobia bacterium]